MRERVRVSAPRGEHQHRESMRRVQVRIEDGRADEISRARAASLARDPRLRTILYPDLHTTASIHDAGMLATWALTPNAARASGLRFPEQRGIARRPPVAGCPRPVGRGRRRGRRAAAHLSTGARWRCDVRGRVLGRGLIASSCRWRARRDGVHAAAPAIARSSWRWASGELPFPVLGTAAEILFWISVPYLKQVVSA